MGNLESLHSGSEIGVKSQSDPIRILLVDDDANILKVIKMRLEAQRYLVTATGEPESAAKTAARNLYDLALLDLKLAGKNGIDLMETLHEINPEMPIIILTAYGTIETAVEAMKRGAAGYVTKPFEYPDLLLQIQSSVEKSRLTREIKRLRELVKERYGFENVIGNSEKMARVMEQVGQAAKTDSSVYIEGESGTGKELIARALHAAGLREEKPFVAVNCAAIPETLFESELFGYVRGAFTGADRNKKGLFAHANGGTFFMDEISEMPLSMQAKLLRVLQEQEFYPVGSGESMKVDVRLITTSNRDLEAEVEKRAFREDLFYRIHVVVIKLPPLRERKEDIPLLSRFFLKQLSEKTGKEVKGFSPAAMQKLLVYEWPGNVRELKNAVECAVALTDKEIITEDILLKTRQSLESPGMKPFRSAKEDFEKDYLLQLIGLAQGNMSKAAEMAGKYRADLYALMKKYGLKPDDFRNQESS
jgi:two-component system response regulator GlrR